jgi:hypothetical protein
MQRWLVLLLSLPALACSGDAAAVLAEWAKNPALHQNIPDVSWAGYHHGDAPLPTPAVVTSVTAHGAVADDGTDDAPAFAKAIAAAAAKGGGAVEVPAGTWEFDDVLRLSADGVILRGAGRDKTKLLFRKSLKDRLSVPPLRGQTQWSWSGGLVWIGPSNTWKDDGTLNPDHGLQCEAWESWRTSGEIGKATAAAPAGSRTIMLDQTGGLKPGQWIILEYRNPADRSLVKAMAGHPLVADGDLEDIGRVPSWPWPVQVEAIEGKQLTLAQPLRLELRPEWEVRALVIDGLLREAGIEHLTIATSGFRGGLRHNTYPGWNGIYLNRCADCFVRDVRIQDVDNGIIHAAAKSTTVSGFTISGGQHHHATALRVKSHDNLLEDFVIESSPMHGINTEGLSSGNVWRRGKMAHGTFDSHCGMSFDSVRTDIELQNDGKPGGAGSAGPFLGRRVVHWNIRITGGDGSWVNQPEQLSLGALVGVQGPLKPGVGFAMPPGDKGTIIADAGQLPAVIDLYAAQLKARAPQPSKTPVAVAKADKKAAKGNVAPPAKLPPAELKRWNEAIAARLRASLADQRSFIVDLPRIGPRTEIQAITPGNALTMRTSMGVLELPLASLTPADRANLALCVAGKDDPAGAACAGVFLALAGDVRAEEWLNRGDPTGKLRSELSLPSR